MVAKRDIDFIMRHNINWESFRDCTAMVTGATGRLGMYIVAALANANIEHNLNMKIIALARNKNKLDRVFGSLQQTSALNCLIQDINEPINVTDNVDYIFHTAGAAAPKDFTETPCDTLWGHVNGTHNVLEFARTKNVKKVVYVSTVEIYGAWHEERNIREDDMGTMRCDNARACYPEAKRLCETMLAAYYEQYGVPYIGFRLCHTLGPGIDLNDGRAFAEFLRNVLNDEDIVLLLGLVAHY